MTFLENKIPDFISDRSNSVRQVIFTAIFALVFINLYSPFGVGTWYNITEPELFFYSSLVILTGLLIIAISRIIMHQITRRKSISTGVYIFWIVAEILSLAIVYLILQRSFIEKSGDIFTSFQETVKITSLVLLLPYTLTFLYFSWMDKNRKIEELSGISLAPKASVMIPFRDEKGELRFSVKSSDLLYLEAADNYVCIFYLDRDKKKEYMIRNSLKNLEVHMKENKIIRCHRSFMVNVEKVKIVRREKDGLVLELDTIEKLSLPISQSYVKEIMQLFLKYPLA